MGLNKFLENKIANCTDYVITDEDKYFLDKNGTVEFIVRKLLSRKFRRWAIDDKTMGHIVSCVSACIKNNEPIPFIFSYGGYKMWRLPSHPHPDWAEMFSLSYYRDFLVAVSKVYKPGVKLYLFSDRYIAGMINNIPKESLKKYAESFDSLVKRLSDNLPDNVGISVVDIEDIYDKDELKSEFSDRLDHFMKNGVDAAQERIKHLQELSEMNIIWDGEEDWHLLNDNEKKLKVTQTPTYMDAYYNLTKRAEFVRKDKIMISPLPLPLSVPIGTTKNSVVKFWNGVGVIESCDGIYNERILSIKQYEEALKLKHDIVAVNIPGLPWLDKIIVFQHKFNFSHK